MTAAQLQRRAWRRSGPRRSDLDGLAAIVRSRIAVAIFVFSVVLFLPSSSLGRTPAAKKDLKGGIRIPAIGCQSDGQVGPLDAPKVHDKVVRLPSAIAARLAYYKAQNGLGVLAPRGWHCFATYGSNGENLFVSQQPIQPADLFSSDWKGFSGPAIEMAVSIGDTSGRFRVAEVIARVFPAHSTFAKRVIAEGIEPPSSFPSGPYPRDRLTYRNKEIVEFETPANAEGLGTHSHLQEGDSPICGVAALFGPEPSLLQLSMRLAGDARNLSKYIARQAEQEVKDESR